MRRTVVGATILLVMTAGAAAAQDAAGAAHDRNRCRLAAQVVATGRPAPHESWALAWIASCGAEGGQALAAGLRRQRHSSDAGSLEALTGPTRFLRDGAVLAAALEVAGDRAASFEARVFSLRTLVWYREPRPSSVGFDALATGQPWEGYGACPLSSSSLIPTTGTPLPGDYVARIRTLASRIAAEASEPPDLRRLGDCLRS